MLQTERLNNEWYPVLPAGRLKRRPEAVSLWGRALVLVRLSGRVLCFDDYCPHRHVPLSRGRSDGRMLQCFYHGWRFDADGRAHLPACRGQSADVCLQSHPCREEAGWIWINTGSSPRPFELPQGFECPPDFVCHDSVHALEGDWLHSIENFLDPTHTPYVHRGWLRGSGAQRMQISQSHHPRGFCTEYRLTDRQNGLINRLFDRGIDTNLAVFELPCVAHIDYARQGRLNYRIALAFVPEQPGRIRLSCRICLPESRVPAACRFALLKPFVLTLLRQDQAALRLQRQHKRHPDTPYVLCADDLVIDHLLHLLAGGPEGGDKSGAMNL